VSKSERWEAQGLTGRDVANDAMNHDADTFGLQSFWWNQAPEE
jgi:hypothetical protein